MTARTSEQIRVLVVDDSAFMRKALSMMLESDPMIKVIGTAHDGVEGIEKIRRLKPDLVTMDIEMPRMDGLAALRQIMESDPVPVMMISSLTTEGAQATLEALDLGAVDFIPKQLSYVSLDIVKIKDELLSRIKNIARRKHLLLAQYRQRRFRQSAATAASISTVAAAPRPGSRSARPTRTRPVQAIAIGSSTGGPPALQAVIPALPRNLPVGVLVAQHMPPMFTKSLAERLDGLSQVAVAEAVNGQPIEAGAVLIAPGGRHLTAKRRGSRTYAVVSDLPDDTLYRPCVDVLMNSVADTYGGGSMGVMLTGMGSNGVDGARNIKERGGVMIAQDEDSCVVYGMPRAVVDASLADHVAPIDDIASEILKYF